ncbi:11249_t:CDS:2 [Acaulospora morrowiae]|uniref:11249_t:CDS:1 n=1 Tax=Acaulospora morrowiae TaxID=94023 RepID=A0A9N8VRX4_9GLOM|nr:11249_t:CDS:2 [Acaulospora morrowiae]
MRLNSTAGKAAKAMKAHDYETSLKHLNELVSNYPNNYKIMCDRSMAHYNLNNYRGALNDAEAAKLKKPDRSRAYYICGFIYDKLGEANESIRSLNHALQTSSNDPEALEAHKICAKIYYHHDDYREALKHLNSALQLDPNDSWVLHVRSRIRFDRKEYDQSLADVNALINIESASTNSNMELRHDAFELRGTLHKKLGQYEPAIFDFSSALNIKQKDASLIFKRARVYLKQEKYAEALSDFEKIERLIGLNDVNADPKILRNRGLAHKGLNRFKEALTDFTNALAIEKKSSTYRHRAHVYFILKQLEQSIGDAEKALELDPQDTLAEDLHNRILSRLKRFDKALEGLKKALNANPQNVNALTERGGVYLSMKRYSEALNDLNLAISYQPKNFMALLTRAKVYRIQESYQLSLVDLNNAINVEPHNARLLRNRGKVYTLLNEYNKSIADLDRSMSMEKEPHTSALKYRGISYSKLGKYHEAISDFNNVLNMKPSNSTVYYHRGKTYYHLSEFDNALEDLNKSLEYEENLESFRLRSMIYEQTQEFEKSRSDLDRILSAEPNNTSVLSKRAELNERLKQFQDCVNDLSSVMKLAPQNARALNSRGRMLVRLCRYEEALRDFNKLLEMNENDVETIGLRAEVYQRLGKYEEALNDLKDGIANKPGSKRWLLVVRGGILREQGKFEDALNDINAAIDLPPPTTLKHDLTFSNVAQPGTSKKGTLCGTPEARQEEDKVHAMALCYRGAIMRKMGKTDDALDDLNKALNMDPYNSLALCERSAILRDNDKYDEAWGDLEMVLSNYDDFDE